MPGEGGGILDFGLWIGDFGRYASRMPGEGGGILDFGLGTGDFGRYAPRMPGEAPDVWGGGADFGRFATKMPGKAPDVLVGRRRFWPLCGANAGESSRRLRRAEANLAVLRQKCRGKLPMFAAGGGEFGSDGGDFDRFAPKMPGEAPSVWVRHSRCWPFRAQNAGRRFGIVDCGLWIVDVMRRKCAVNGGRSSRRLRPTYPILAVLRRKCREKLPAFWVGFESSWSDFAQIGRF